MKRCGVALTKRRDASLAANESYHALAFTLAHRAFCVSLARVFCQHPQLVLCLLTKFCTRIDRTVPHEHFATTTCFPFLSCPSSLTTVHLPKSLPITSLLGLAITVYPLVHASVMDNTSPSRTPHTKRQSQLVRLSA